MVPTLSTTFDDMAESGSNTGMTKMEELGWTRLNYKGIHHDNRRLLEHRARDCDCDTCHRELAKLPPKETYQERIAKRKSKSDEQEIKRTKKQAKKEVKSGKQASIKSFFQSPMDW